MTACIQVIRGPRRGTIEEKVVKTLLLGATALAMVVAGSASAQTGGSTGSFEISSFVTPKCTGLGNPSAAIALGSIIDANGFLVSAFTPTGSGTRLVNGVYSASADCNSNALVSLTATPLTTNIVVIDTTSFTNTVHYNANLLWGGLSLTDTSASVGATTVSTGSAKTGALTVAVSTPVADGRPVAGAYAGSVTLTISPQ